MVRSVTLLLADGRLPAGGYAHSGGIEAAVGAGQVSDVSSLRDFLVGRLATTGLMAAAMAAAACSGVHDWQALDAEADARIASPALRAASRNQGRQLLASASAIWPDPLLGGLSAAVPAGPHHPIALGAAAAAAHVPPEDSAHVAAYGSVMAAASAAVRLLGLDPLEVYTVLAELAPVIDDVAEGAAALAHEPLSDLPCPSGPQTDLWAEWHAGWDVRLFAS